MLTGREHNQTVLAKRVPLRLVAATINAEIAEIRRGTQRATWMLQGRVCGRACGVKIVFYPMGRGIGKPALA
jgi:hypothetical protein